MRLLVFLALVAFTPALGQDTHSDGDHAADPGMEVLTPDTAPFRQQIKLTCTFTTECVEAEPCTETKFAPQITGVAGGLTPEELMVQTQMITDAETIDLLGVKSGMALSLAGGTFAARHLVSIAKDEAARYTVHYADGPFVISYLGTCN